MPGVTYWADPLGPKFRVQLMWGLRFLQASLLVPEYRRGGCAARGLPVAFTEVPFVKRPGRWASVADRIAYKKAASQHNLSTAYQRELATIREQLDRTGAYSKVLIAVVDGSFCNRACMRTEVERTTLVARARKDARLCFPADDALQPRRIYGAEKFTPEQVRQDDRRPWKQARVFHGKRYRSIRYKEVGPVLWQRATGPKPLRLIVIAPTRYRPRTKAARAKSKYYYHEFRILALHRPVDPGERAYPEVLRPVADRSQPQGGEGHAGDRTGPVALTIVGSPATGPLCSRLQHLDVGEHAQRRPQADRCLP